MTTIESTLHPVILATLKGHEDFAEIKRDIESGNRFLKRDAIASANMIYVNIRLLPLFKKRGFKIKKSRISGDYSIYINGERISDHCLPEKYQQSQSDGTVLSGHMKPFEISREILENII